MEWVSIKDRASLEEARRAADELERSDRFLGLKIEVEEVPEGEDPYLQPSPLPEGCVVPAIIPSATKGGVGWVLRVEKEGWIYRKGDDPSLGHSGHHPTPEAAYQAAHGQIDHLLATRRRQGELNAPLVRVLYLIRGLPGSGKTTLAHKLVPKRFVCEADDHFTDERGNYTFRKEELPEAHRACQLKVDGMMRGGVPEIVVSNTFTQMWEMAAYQDLAEAWGYTVQVISLSAPWQSVHGIPGDVVADMRFRWESSPK